MTSAGGHEDREPRLDAVLNAVKHRLAFAFLYPKELIELVNLATDIFPGLEAHHDELAIFAEYKTVRKSCSVRRLLDVVDVTFHNFLIPSLGLRRNLIGEKVPWGSSEFHEQHAIMDSRGDL